MMTKATESDSSSSSRLITSTNFSANNFFVRRTLESDPFTSDFEQLDLEKKICKEHAWDEEKVVYNLIIPYSVDRRKCF